MKYELRFEQDQEDILKNEHEKIKSIIDRIISNQEKNTKIDIFYCKIDGNKTSVSIKVVRPCINKKEFDNISFNGFAIMDLIKHGYRINGFDNAIFKKRNYTEIHLIKDF